MRKKRADRNHLIYKITCIVTGDHYIGVTVMKGPAKVRTLNQRWKAHQYKALTLKEQWTLPKAIRKYGVDNFELEIVDIIRGKAEAFAYEAEIINTTHPKLNTKKRNK